MALRLLPTTVVGSYPQPDWLVDRAMLSKGVARVRLDLWRVAEPWLEQAQDDATLLAIRDMERAGIDIITDGEMRRESYSNRFATSLKVSNATSRVRSSRRPAWSRPSRASSGPSAAPIRSKCATWSFFAAIPTGRQRSRCRVRSR